MIKVLNYGHGHDQGFKIQLCHDPNIVENRNQMRLMRLQMQLHCTLENVRTHHVATYWCQFWPSPATGPMAQCLVLRSKIRDKKNQNILAQTRCSMG